MSDGVLRTYRSTTLGGLGGAAGVLGVVAAVWILVDALGRGHWLVAAAAALWAILVALLVVEVFFRPAVSVTPDGVVLVNPFRTVVVPWAAVRGVETEFALQVRTDGRRHTSWAATGRRGSSMLFRGQGIAPSPGPPSMRELMTGTGSADSMSAPEECMMFIEAGLSEWRNATAGAAASARTTEPGTGLLPVGSQGLDPASDAARPGAARVSWHLRSVLAIAVTAALVLGVTLAL